MLAIVVLTPLFLLILITVAFAAGGGIVWLIARLWRRSVVDTSESEALYLIVTRLSHRLKTVGEVIRGHLYGLTEELPSEADRWRVSRRAISDEASEISSLSQRLDLVVRLGMSSQPLVMETVNVPALIEDIMVDLAPAAEDKGLTLSEIVRDEPSANVPHLSGDESVLREVFSNLIENAIKHNGAGTQVNTEVKAVGRRMEITISDSGSGIAPDQLKNMYARANRRHTRGEISGTGMGMYLCKLLVELHGGDISAESTPGEGTTFTVSLPMRRSR